MNEHSPFPTGESRLAEALSGCAEEPVHIPGAIQPHGCLLCLDVQKESIRQVSANLADVLGISPEQALRESPRHLLGDSLYESLVHALASPGDVPESRSAHLGPEQRRFQLTAYRSGTWLVVELEPLLHEDDHRLLVTLNRWLMTMGETTGQEQLWNQLVAKVREITGFDRVLIYRFDERWNGSVVAESLAENVDSLLGHHFPASDIPPQVRHLYDRNRLRSIPDATAPAVPLLAPPEGGSDPPLDLSLGLLRAVSPIHQEYLANMGVASALSVALHDDEERLSGLLSCHALDAPLALSPSVRDAVHALVLIAVPQLMLLRSKHESDLLQRVQVGRELLNKAHERWIDPDLIVSQRGTEWLELFRADGLALLHRNRCGRRGSLPDAANLERLVTWLGEHADRTGAWYSHCLKETPLADWRSESCGLLAVLLPIDTEQPSWLLLFRNEQVTTRRWAGKPEKRARTSGDKLVLAPRRSFAEWQEKVSDHSRVWRRSERRAASDLAENLAAIIASHEIHLLNARLRQVNDRLERLASHDSLTGVWNRYRIEQAIEDEIAAATRYSRDCALLLFDVDHFKAVNDDHGHEVGDKVLMTLVSRVEETLRETDRLGRWGGEEFIVLATGTDARGAEELAERIRQRIMDTHFEEVGRVTASIGIAACRPQDDLKTLVARADHAMYQAKQTGRNCVHSAD
ncbi:sensor domain-containing diguanylate cyclase [Billgrantia gudaonensis]|uniref:diguanylate cyclase n=1 Tax=Billgrantia gudaonensis TaxID=376427 RepID=A0A1G8VDY5_9GAMM|nr:sensor domain-containing diguanylate cyclase [Halomonas gudaonensis]SDJ64301.1 diguanylate cyclase (GGDEF) domain-containing protein [Halomonas gudaonensis]